MAKVLVSVLAFLLGLTDATAADVLSRRPQRIVSTNYCTDQILLRLVEPERIKSLTYLSWMPDETPPDLRPALRNIKQNRGLAEEVLQQNPDLVLGGEFSATFSNALLRKLGKRLYTIKTQNTFEEWYKTVIEIGDEVGEPARAAKLVSDFKTSLAALQTKIPPGERPLYAELAVNYNFPGKDTLDSALVKAGGFMSIGEALNFEGYRQIPLEQLIQLDVDLISAGSQYENPPSLATENQRHPLLRRMAKRAYAAIDIPARYSVCTTPETLKMIEQLIQARRDVDAAKAKARGRRALAG